MTYIRPALQSPLDRTAWYEAQAAGVLRFKRLARGNFETTQSAIREAHEQIYRGVAFDIDGTLTLRDGIDVDPDMADVVSGLLKRGVPVLLSTGRGRTSTKTAVSQILQQSQLHPSYLRRLRCATHNGLIYLSTPNRLPATPLSAERTLTRPLESLPNLSRLLIDYIRTHGINATLSEEPSGIPYGIRILFSSKRELTLNRSAILTVIDTVMSGRPYYLTQGSYGFHTSLDISNARKLLGLEAFADDIGVSISQVLCVGDQGAIGGNDFDLLDRLNGFSVGSLSKRPDGCFPVCSDDGREILTGAAATRELLARVLLFPAISIAPEPADQRLASLVEFERIALSRAREEATFTLGRIKARLRFSLDSRARESLPHSLSIDDLLDPRSGGVRLKESEIEDIQHYELVSRLFTLGKLLRPLESAPQSRWSMFTDEYILLGGPFYYFGWTQEQNTLGDYLPPAKNFVEISSQILSLYASGRVNFASFKVTTAIMDNIRNILLNVLYAAFSKESLIAEEYHYTEEYFVALTNHLRHFTDLLVNTDRQWTTLCRQAAARLLRLLQSLNTLEDDESPAGCFVKSASLRNWREADNFLENYTAVHLALQEFFDQYPEEIVGTNVVGLGYGGLELPALAKAITDPQIWRLSGSILDLSIYHDTTIGDAIRGGEYNRLSKLLIQNRHLFNDEGLHWNYNLQQRKILLLDDNCTTGVSLQLARDLFVGRGADVLGAAVVRFAGANRHVQMAIPGHGFPDPEMYFSFIRGLVNPSPYSRLLFLTDGEDRYLDNLGIFCRARVRIRDYLIKNGTPPLRGKRPN